MCMIDMDFVEYGDPALSADNLTAADINQSANGVENAVSGAE